MNVVFYCTSANRSSQILHTGPLILWLSDKLVAYNVAGDVDGQNRVIALVSGGMAPNWNESWRLELC